MVKRILVGLLLLPALSLGCTDSSAPIGTAGSPSSDATATPSNSNTSTTGINGPHSGEIWTYYDQVRGSERFNLQTGKITKVSEAQAFPTTDGSKFIEVFRDYATVESAQGCLWDDIDLFNIRDTRSGNVTNSFKFANRSIRLPIRLSPDGERIAMFVSDGTNCGDNATFNRRLTVFSKNGEQLYRSADETITAFDWHPNGRLVILKNFSDDNNTSVLQIEDSPGAYAFTDTYGWTSPASVRGLIGLRVGPTGNDAVVEAVLGSANFLSGVRWRDGEPLHFPLFEPADGTALLFSHKDGDTPRVNAPTFSPHSQHVLVTEGFSFGTLAYNATFPDLDVLGSLDVWPVSAASTSYIVSVREKLQPMPPTQYSDSIRPVLAVRDDGSISTVSFDPRYPITWTPVID